MVRIDGGGAVRNQVDNPAAKPKPVEPKPVVQPADHGAAKIGQQQQSAGMRRLQIERNFERTEAARPQTPQSAEQQARQAAAEVQNTYAARSAPQATNRGATISDGLSPHAAAAQRLREVTANQKPEVAALTIKYAQPTIDRITADLGKTAVREDGNFDRHKPKFDNVVNDLAIVANKAANAPNGKAAVDVIARSVAKNINPDDIGRFDEALGKTVSSGAGAELAAATVKQLQAAGKTDEANNVLGAVKDGVNQLHDRAADLQKQIGENAAELSWLVEQWKPLMSEKQLEGAIDGYKKQNPEFDQGLQELDQIAVKTLRALDGFAGAEKDFAGLKQADDVANAFKDLFNDEKTANLIQQSSSATGELDRLMDKAEKNPNDRDFFANLGNIVGKLDSGKKLTEGILNKVLDATIEKSLDASRRRDFNGAQQQIDKLEKYADKLGYRSTEFKAVVKQLGKVANSVNAAIAAGDDPTKAAKSSIKKLTRKLEALERTDPTVFGSDSSATNKFKTAGVLFGAAAVAQSLPKAISEGGIENIARALSDTGGLATDTAQLGLVKNALSGKAWFNGLPFEKAGKAFGGLGIALDTISAFKSITEGEYVDAGFSAASAAGGALAIFGATAAVTGVGLVIVGAAAVGKILWDKHQESVKHETDDARAFLRGAGINDRLANELINNDSDGRSAAPVFNAFAKHFKADPKQFFDYLSKLKPDDAKRLMEAAHGVDPDDNGNYAVSKENSRGFLGLNYDENPNDLLDLAVWMKDNGFADAPGIPANFESCNR